MRIKGYRISPRMLIDPPPIWTRFLNRIGVFGFSEEDLRIYERAYREDYGRK